MCVWCDESLTNCVSYDKLTFHDRNVSLRFTSNSLVLLWVAIEVNYLLTVIVLRQLNSYLTYDSYIYRCKVEKRKE